MDIVSMMRQIGEALMEKVKREGIGWDGVCGCRQRWVGRFWRWGFWEECGGALLVGRQYNSPLRSDVSH